MEKTPRDIIIDRLMDEVNLSMTRDIVTVTQHLKRYREIRSGKQIQRKAKRNDHNNRWRKTDNPITW